nr:hypothetical protein CDL12_20539 [Ipomoea batatas]
MISSPVLCSSIRNTGIQGSPRQSAQMHAHIDAQRQHTRSHACSSAKSVASSADACLQEPMAINKSALVTIIGRPREVALNVPS